MENQEGTVLEHGPLGVIALNSCAELGAKVDRHLRTMREEYEETDSYIIPLQQDRFANGEGKVTIKESVRGRDIYVLGDVGNYGCSYKMFGFEHHMGPDEHFQDFKRVLSAIGGKANRVTVIMPLLYSSRQHRRKNRESLDCAMGLQELQNMGVQAIITFDAHDPNIQNAIPCISFENIFPTYTILKYFFHKDCWNINKDNTVVISPDTGAMDRAVYYANVLNLDVGMFYKRRDHTVVVNGKNPIIQHEYIGRDVEGKTVMIVDDMIASGESVLDIIVELKKRGAKRTFVMSTFAFFTEGVQKFRDYYEKGMLDRVYTTNASYLPDSLKGEEWFVEVDISKFIAKIINTLNHDLSISPLLNANERIRKLIQQERP